MALTYSPTRHTPGKPSHKNRQGAGRSVAHSTYGSNSPARKKTKSPDTLAEAHNSSQQPKPPHLERVKSSSSTLQSIN